MFDLIYWDPYYNKILFLNLLIVIGLFSSLRLFSGFISRVSATHELITKDNPAFGISLAGVTFAVTIILSGTIYGRPGDNAFDAMIAVGLYGVLGILLMGVTRFIFDKITLPKFSVRDEIIKGNVAAAIADTSNIIAAAVIIRAVMVWINDSTIANVLELLTAFVVAQVILTGVTVLKIKTFGRLFEGNSIQQELLNGNTALALRFAGKKIGTAFAISVAAQLVVYEIYEVMPIIFAWFVVSIAAIIALKLLTMIAEKIILYGVDLNKEVVEQRNIAVGAVQGVIYIALGMLIATI